MGCRGVGREGKGEVRQGGVCFRRAREEWGKAELGELRP